MVVLFFYYAESDSGCCADAIAGFRGISGYVDSKSDYQPELAKLYRNQVGCASSTDEPCASVFLFSFDTDFLFPDDIFQRVCASGNSFIFFPLWGRAPFFLLMDTGF